MIAKIKNISGSAGMAYSLSYQFDKIEKGIGELLIDNISMFSEQATEESCLKNIEHIMKGNKKMRENYGYDISLNLPVNEIISDDKFKKIALDYLKGMGYDNTAFAVFKHTDKDHTHIHILLPSIDFEGNRLVDSNNFYRSQKLTRSLEIKYDLKYTEYDKSVSHQSLNEINARKYYYQTALKKGLAAYSTKAAIEEILTPKEIQHLKNNALDNKGIADYIGSVRDGKLRAVLTANKHFGTLYKEELAVKLDYLLKNSGSVNEFLNKLDANEIYVRKVCKRGKMSFVYGLPAENMYFDDKALSARFRYSNLVETGGAVAGIEMDKDSQKEFIKHNAMRLLGSCSSIADLNNRLAKNDIELILVQDRGGVTEAKFKIGDDANKDVFSGEEISGNLKYENMLSIINNRIDSAPVSDFEQIQQEAPRPEFVMPYIPVNGKKSKGDDEDDNKNKNKKKKQGIKR